MFSFAISRGPVYTAISNFKVVFSTLQSSSCCQLANSYLLRGHKGLLLRIDILSFLLPIGIFLRWFVGSLEHLDCTSFFPNLVVVS